MTDVSLPAALLASILLVSILTLVIAIRNLLSSRRSEALGEDRYELLRDQHDRLELLREERQVLIEELEREFRKRQQLMEFLGKMPQQPVEDLNRERGEHLETQERLENLKQERLRLELSGSDYRSREKSPQEGERKEAIEQPVWRSPRRTGGKAEATDAAKRKAEELGVDLCQVEGSGANGRIRVKDVLNAATRKTREDQG
jgi:pyruvate/2-oxoglutarate dehydrogenase complex dihydrolipoamide acyltransferase (E2) component